MCNYNDAYGFLKYQSYPQGLLPLHVVYTTEHHAVVELLLKNEVDISALGKNILGGHDKALTVLRLAASRGDKRLHLENKAVVSILAAYGGHEIIQLLLENGVIASIPVPNSDGRTTLHRQQPLKVHLKLPTCRSQSSGSHPGISGINWGSASADLIRIQSCCI